MYPPHKNQTMAATPSAMAGLVQRRMRLPLPLAVAFSLCTFPFDGRADTVNINTTADNSRNALKINGSSTREYHRGPWPTNPACMSSVLLDPPGHRRGTPIANCSTGTTCSEYAYFADVPTVSECVNLCCSDWSCWAFTFYPAVYGRKGSNREPNGPGHSCDGTTACCVLLNDMHDPVVPSKTPRQSRVRHGGAVHPIVRAVQSGVRAKLPARWDAAAFAPSTAIKHAEFGDKLYVGGASVYPKGGAGGWDLGDEFPTTWADDGYQYSGAGDNSGGPAYPGTDSPLTLWRIDGRTPPAARFNLQGTHAPINGPALLDACPIRRPMPTNATPGGPPNIKSQSLLALDGMLYWAVACFDYVDPDLSKAPGPRGYSGLDPVFNRQRYGVNDTSFIAASSDHGLTWDTAISGSGKEFRFFRGRLASPRFINAGQGYRDAPDQAHVYAVFVGTDADTAYFENNDAMWLGRVPRGQLLDRTAWTFYTGMSAGVATWSVDDSLAVSIFRHPLMTAMQQVTYNVALKRYMMAVWSWVDADGNPRGQLTSTNTEGPAHDRSGTRSNSPIKDGHDRTQLSLWEATQPWGPWRWFHRDDDWKGPDGSSGGYTPVLPPAWLSDSGTEMWVVFTQCCPGRIAGPANHYNFTYQRITLTLL